MRDMECLQKLLTGALAMMLYAPVLVAGDVCDGVQDRQADCKNGKGTAIVAHRGYWNCEKAGYARNSLAALKCAQEAGFWGSEFDVNMTSDEVLLVYHDSSIDGKPIEKTPYSEFRDVRLENGEPVPTVDDFFAQVKKCPGTVMVYELKSHSTTELENRLVDLTIDKLEEYGLASPDKVIFISFSINICKRLAMLMPGYTVQYLADDLSPEDLAGFGISGVDYHFSVFSRHPDWYKSARMHSMSVNAWTVDKEKDMNDMFSVGVDMLTTDKPDVARSLLGEKEVKPGNGK